MPLLLRLWTFLFECVAGSDTVGQPFREYILARQRTYSSAGDFVEKIRKDATLLDVTTFEELDAILKKRNVPRATARWPDPCGIHMRQNYAPSGEPSECRLAYNFRYTLVFTRQCRSSPLQKPDPNFSVALPCCRANAAHFPMNPKRYLNGQVRRKLANDKASTAIRNIHDVARLQAAAVS
jgi:hypothetical protein